VNGIETRHYGADTSLTVRFPWSTYLRGRVLCADGVVRATRRVGPTSDTFFSIPASVAVRGKTVSGYVTVECLSGSSVPTDGDPAVAKFVAYTYGRNADRLPAGAYRPNSEDPT
jgi:hypothetical protein